MLTMCSGPKQEVCTIYVSPNGDDGAAGTKQAPLKTLECARDWVRAIRKKGLPQGGVQVVLRGGTYRRIGRPLELDGRDSGEAGRPVVWKAYPGEMVLFTGGATAHAEDFAPVTDPAIRERLPESARDAVRVCDLTKLGLTDIGPIRKVGFKWPEYPPPLSVAVDGERYSLARYPHQGFLKHDTIVNPGFVPRDHLPDPDGTCPACSQQAGGKKRIPCKYTEQEFLHQPGPVWTIQESELKGKFEKWIAEPDPWTFGYFCWSWAEDNLSIKKIERIEKDGVMYLCFTGGEPSRYGARSQGANGILFYLYNLLCELEQPGEWYLDRESNKLYLYPRKDLAQSTVEFSVMAQPFIQIKNAEEIRLENLSFTMGNANAVEVCSGKRVVIAGCRFTNMGQLGVVIDGGRENLVQSCDFYRTGAGGVSVSGGDRLTLTPADHRVENCRFEDYAVIKRTYSPAIALSGVGNRAVRNQILNAPHQAISFAGNDHIIENNDICNVCYETADSGAIYSVRSWTERGTRINNNYIHDMISNAGGGSAAVYLDDLIGGITITKNLIVNMPGRVFLIGGGRDNNISNNIVMNPNTGTGFQYDERGMGWAHVAGHIPNGVCYADWKVWMDKLKMPGNEAALVRWKQRYPELFVLNFEESEICPECGENRSRWGCRPGGARIENNILTGVARPYDSVGETVKNEAVAYANNPVLQAFAEIGFEDPENGRFTLKPNSHVEQIQGTEHFDPARVGLYQDKYRTKLAADLSVPELIAPANGAEKVEISGGAQLSWSPVKGAGWYQVEIFDLEQAAEPICVLRTRKTQVRVSGLACGEGYFWRVIAREERLNGVSTASGLRSFTTAQGDQAVLFDGFGDADFTGWDAPYGNPSRCEGTAHSGRFSYQTAANQDAIEKRFGAPQHQIAQLWLFDTMQMDPMTASIADAAPDESHWASIGVNVRKSPDRYVVRIGQEWQITGVKRSGGWHRLMWDYSDGIECRMYLDEVLVGSFAAAGFRIIRIGDYWKDQQPGNISTILYDDLQIGNPSVEPVPTDIRLKESEITVKLGQEQALSVQLTTNLDLDLALVWDTAEYEIARVSETGVIHGLRPGQTVVTVHAEGFEFPEAHCAVRVLPK